MKTFTSITIVVLLAACGQKNKKADFSRVAQVRTLIKKIGIQQLPFTYDLTKGPGTTRHFISPNSSDTIFLNPGVVAGIFPDTTNFYGILHYQAGDLIYPYVSTFDKQGNLITSQNIGIGYCGGLLLDLDTCIDRVTINKNLEIKAIYQVIGTKEDSTGQTAKFCESMVSTGKIMPDGNIEIKKQKAITSCL